ncbi:Ethylene-responsive transcription factor CRF2 [Hondaea fermentalgiana]|uniref:Ethylene-responsive transcription factor CRF2 n=1 Tax=Hondaea fermentalgiana TaxID=2315210 RepID=A0A2R5GRF3_9STRA|nr:Ethylene-responsive transcription factor CRF2 [Hondaea fermentalgiana]|eukprot:GBG33175.1 Ethylene-responsive transcription factor CRF2 [Hondaea fermentalgiana]
MMDFAAEDLEFMFDDKDSFMPSGMDASFLDGGDLFDGYAEQLDSPLSSMTDDDGIVAAAEPLPEIKPVGEDIIGWPLPEVHNPIELSAPVVPAPAPIEVNSSNNITYMPMRIKEEPRKAPATASKKRKAATGTTAPTPKKFCTPEHVAKPAHVSAPKPSFRGAMEMQQKQKMHTIKQQQQCAPVPSMHVMQHIHNNNKMRPAPLATAPMQAFNSRLTVSSLPTSAASKPEPKPESVSKPKPEPVASATPAVTPKTNSANAEKGRQTSTFRGVSCCGKDRKWQARIRDATRVRYLGRFTTELEAALVYDNAARQIKGIKAPTNFVDMDNDTLSVLKEAFAKHGCVPNTLQHLVHCPRKVPASSDTSSTVSDNHVTPRISDLSVNGDFPDSPLAKVIVKAPAMAPHAKTKATAASYNPPVQSLYVVNNDGAQHHMHPHSKHMPAAQPMLAHNMYAHPHNM